MKNRWLIPSFLMIPITLVIAGYMKATVNHNNEFFLLFHLTAQYLFAWTVIYETNHSAALSSKDKKMWKGIMLISPFIFGCYYLFSMRKKIFPTSGGYSM